MKKALLIGAVVSSMALSSVSFAAVDYQNATAWTKGTDFNYDIATGVLTVANGKTNAAATTDTTIVVVNGENPTTIDQTNIMYIDQAASADTYGNMGLLLPATIAEGAKATVLFNDGTAAIYTATFDLAEEVVTPPVVNTDKVVFGDVTDGVYTGEATTDLSVVTGADAAAILAATVTGGIRAQGGYASIGDVIELANGTKVVFGDVTDGVYTGEATTDLSVVTGADAAAILAATVTGGIRDQGGYASIGNVIEVKAE